MKQFNVFVLLILLTASGSYASTIDLDKLITIESNWNPSAKNMESGAIGLCQITPACLKEWNNFHLREKYTTKQLYDPQINMRIGYWYVNDRIPKMLKAYELPDNIKMRLWAYNAGIGRVLKGFMPAETREYVRRYLTA